jgi:hypothetical protein
LILLDVIEDGQTRDEASTPPVLASSTRGWNKIAKSLEFFHIFYFAILVFPDPERNPDPYPLTPVSSFHNIVSIFFSELASVKRASFWSSDAT